MKPVMMSLSVLQSEANTDMGRLLPTILQLQAKLTRVGANSKVCLPLVRALQEGLQERFGQMMRDPEFISAAILLPKFKTSWTDNADVIEAGRVSSLFVLRVCQIIFLTSKAVL